MTHFDQDSDTSYDLGEYEVFFRLLGIRLHLITQQYLGMPPLLHLKVWWFLLLLSTKPKLD